MGLCTGTLALWTMAGCPEAPPPPPPPKRAAPRAATPTPSQPHAPMTQSELATTDGQIAVDNLSAALAGAEVALRSNPQVAAAYSKVVQLLRMRGLFLGRLADYEQAAAVSAQQVKAVPKEAQTYQMRAAVRSTFHDFAGALADLDQSEKLGASAAANLEERAALLVATGRVDEALALLGKLSGPARDAMTQGAHASLLGELGQLDQAEAMFIEAQKLLPDVSPFPLAWVYFQQGLMWENAGRSGRARELYAAAAERVPGYAAATSHLAAMEAASGERDRAIERLREIVKTSDDPEHQAQLSALLKESGHAVDAEELRRRAQERYAALLKRYPAAFAAHAARFYLGVGAEAQSAVKWAEQNLKNVPTVEAHALAIEANLAARATARACALADQLTAKPRLSARAKVMAARAYVACGKQPAADALLGSGAQK